MTYQRLVELWGLKGVNMKKSILILGMAALASGAFAQVLLGFNSAYSQNFDGLTGITGGALSGVRDYGSSHAGAGMNGWYTGPTSGSLALNPSTGSSFVGSAYHFGSSGSAERALGAMNTNATGRIFHVVRFKNNSSTTFNKITVSYRGEQWSKYSATADKIDVRIRPLSTTFNTSMVNTTASFSDPIAGLTFNQLDTTGATGARDGNATGLNASFSQAVTSYTVLSGPSQAVSIAPGQEFLVQWVDDNAANNDAGMGIDNVEILAVPEPGTMAAIGLGLAALAKRRKKS